LVISDEDSARLEDGVLAGSLLTLDAAVRNLVAFAGCPVEDAVAAVTRVPARLLGLDASIRAGSKAELTLLTPDLRAVGTIVGGRVVFTAEGEASRWA
jgi:N-acetylglucosamine-6-phosphate deacetylase